VVDLVYPPVVVAIKGLWKYLGFTFDFNGHEKIPRKGGAILAINHTSYLDFALAGTAVLPTKRYVRFMAKKRNIRQQVGGPAYARDASH
jgi:1-acyl-sn-glycerol-3-phosphate acyltransferase